MRSVSWSTASTLADAKGELGERHESPGGDVPVVQGGRADLRSAQTVTR